MIIDQIPQATHKQNFAPSRLQKIHGEIPIRWASFIQLRNWTCASRLKDENDVSVGIAKLNIPSLVRLQKFMADVNPLGGSNFAMVA